MRQTDTFLEVRLTSCQGNARARTCSCALSASAFWAAAAARASRSRSPTARTSSSVARCACARRCCASCSSSEASLSALRPCRSASARRRWASRVRRAFSPRRCAASAAWCCASASRRAASSCSDRDADCLRPPARQHCNRTCARRQGATAASSSTGGPHKPAPKAMPGTLARICEIWSKVLLCLGVQAVARRLLGLAPPAALLRLRHCALGRPRRSPAPAPSADARGMLRLRPQTLRARPPAPAPPLTAAPADGNQSSMTPIEPLKHAKPLY